MRDEIPEPWLSFLRELDSLIVADPTFGVDTVDLHCFGGFVVTLRYNLERSTNDLDVMTARPYRVRAVGYANRETVLMFPIAILGTPTTTVAAIWTIQKHGHVHYCRSIKTS